MCVIIPSRFWKMLRYVTHGKSHEVYASMGGVVHRQAKPERWAVLACRCGRSMGHSSLNFDPVLPSVALRFFS